jgi:hypothetical protein
MIDRYIHAVTKELPIKVKNEIGSELKALIDDMMYGMDNALSEEEKIDKVLRELGNPKELANRYRGKERYLIGPNYFDKYLFVVKIVLLSIFIGVSVATGLGVVFSNASTAKMVGDYIGTLFSAILQGAAWVTGIFALLEYNEISVETGAELEAWEPSQLPELPDKKALISRGESVFDIMITTIILSLFFFLPEIVGNYYRPDGESGFIPLFNIEGIAPLKVIIFLVFTLNILIELIKIIKGRWTMKTAIITTVLNIISAALFVNVIYNTNIWNSEIVQKFEQYKPKSFEGMIFLTAAVIIIVTIGESVSALYKGIKYGGKK